MIKTSLLIDNFPKALLLEKNKSPWKIVSNLENTILNLIKNLNSDYFIKDNIAIHKSAVVESSAILKGAIIIEANCFVAANCYLRGGVYLSENSKLGPGCEVKSSIICSNSSMAHFNYIGDSIIGSGVNFEAGAVIANHFNEKENKEVLVLINNEIVNTKLKKFGACVGDNSKIGANAVLSPGTILKRNSIVKRLELIEQIKHDLS